MPRKSIKKYRIDGRRHGPFTPRELRALLMQGTYEFANRAVPKPPEEWKPWKRMAMARCIEAAWMFLRGKKYGEIRKNMGDPGITRQRVAMRVKVGTKFFVDRDWLRRRESKGEKQ